MVIARRTSWYAVGTVSAFTVSILSLPIGTLVLAPRDYGIFALVTALLGIGSLFTMVPCQVVLTKDLQTADGDERASLITTVLVFTLLSCSALGAIAVTIVAAFSSWFEHEWTITLPIALAGTGAMAASTLWNTLAQLLVLDGRARAHGLASIGAAGATLAVLSASLFLLELGTLSLFAAQIGGSLVAFAAIAALYRREITGPVDRHIFRRILTAVPSASVSTLMDAFYRAAERAILTAVAGPAALGLYAHAQTYSQAVNQGLKTISLSVWPESLREACEVPPVFSTTRRVYRYLHILLLTAGLVFVPISDLVVSGLTHGKFADAASLAALWMAAAAIQNAGILNLAYLYANGLGAVALRVNAISALAGIVLLPALVPHFGIYGAFGAMVGHLLVRRIGLAIQCRRYALPSLDGRLYAIAIALAGLSAAKAFWTLTMLETLWVSAAIMAIWLAFDRRTVGDALSVFVRMESPSC
ncbi:MAG: lipopolysaccharide biosynthesis protein [Proteobacteria bacterium]|nr:lipopolysaccharide biosynthesis protein [Pseudomonadota bacterium]